MRKNTGWPRIVVRQNGKNLVVVSVILKHDAPVIDSREFHFKVQEVDRLATIAMDVVAPNRSPRDRWGLAGGHTEPVMERKFNVIFDFAVHGGRQQRISVAQVKAELKANSELSRFVV